MTAAGRLIRTQICWVCNTRALRFIVTLLFPASTNCRKRHDSEFERIHRTAGVHLSCNEDHEHTDSCHCYGYHDLRRAFATVNAETWSADSLQALMRHKSYTTTQRYINMAHQLNRSAEGLHVPEVLRAVSAN